MRAARRVREGACGKRPVATPAPRPRAYLTTCSPAPPPATWGAGYYASRTDIDRKTRNHIRPLEALGFTVTLARAA